MPPKQAQVKGVGASSSPGGTKTIDFKIGGAYGGDLGGGFQPNGSEDEAQAALLDDLLASAEDEHFRRDDDVQVKQPQQQKHSITSSSRNSHNTPTSRNPSQQRQGGPLPDSHGEKASGLKPSALAAKYGVDYDGVDSDSDDDFGPDDDVNVGSSAAGGGAGVGAKAGANPSASEFGPLAAAAQENLTLKAELDERRQQVKKLGVMLECLAPVPGLDAEKLLDVMEGADPTTVDPRDSKIVHLAKKNRNLTLENAKLKEKAAAAAAAATKQAAEIAALQQQLEAMASPAARAAVMKQLASNNENQQGGSSKASAGKGSKTSPLSGGTSPSAPGGDETHKDELLKKKDRELVEARRRVSSAQEEVTKLKHALHKELGLAEGDKLPYEKVVNGEGSGDGGDGGEHKGEGWRGRAETIVLLRSKVHRLESELEAATGRKNPKAAAKGASSSHGGSKADRQAKQDLAEMEEARRAATEQLTADFSALSEAHGAMKQKLEGAKARTAGLEMENGKMRKNMKQLLEKASGDDELVDALRQELKTVNAELATTKQRLEKEMKSSSMSSYHPPSNNNGIGGPGPRTFKAGPSFTSLVHTNDNDHHPNPLTKGQTTTTATTTAATRPPRQRVQYEDDDSTFLRPSSGHSYGGGEGGHRREYGEGYEGGEGTLQPVTARGPRATRRREDADGGEEYDGYGDGEEGDNCGDGTGAAAGAPGGVGNNGGGNRRGSNADDGRRRRPGMETNLPPSKFRTSSSR